jgi:hypothetical protein
MTDEAFTEAIDVVRRRIARVRRRHGLREAARVACLLLALGAIGAAAGLTLALHVGARLFAIAAWTLAVVVPAAGLLTIAIGWRRRLPDDRAARWIDAQATLGGRLASFTELAARGRRDAFFLPLLADQNLDRLPAWPPERLVPQIAPRGEMAAAVAALAMLGLTIALAPASRPQVGVGPGASRPSSGAVATPDDDEHPDRATAASPADAGTLAGLPVAIQNRLRDVAWGDDWAELPPASAARATPPPERRAARRPSDDDARLAGLRAQDRPEHDGEARPADAEQPDPAERQADDAIGEGPPGSGAGTGTDPNLLGNASEPTDGRATFELALGARVRTRRERPHRSPDEAPPAEPDARPALATGERRVVPIHRMPVPAAYEEIVRAAFGHRTTVEAQP